MKSLLFAVLSSVACFSLNAQTGAPAAPNPDAEAAKNVERILPLLKRPQNPAQAADQAEAILKLLTDDEKFALVCGGGMSTVAIPRLGLPRILFTDASAGVRIEQNRRNMIEKTTAFPCTQLLTAAWNPQLAFDYGKAVGEECRAAGIHVLLGPGVNILRTSVNGRNFEYMGEDPYLASRTVERYVKGLQEVGVLGTVKHYVCNNSDHKRRSYNAVVDERSLHEIYTPAFKAAVDAGVWCVMTSYNLVNGEWVAQNKELIDGFLRRDLGFQGLVMTDWSSTWYGDKVLEAGTDLDMPSGEALKLEKAQLVGRPEIHRMARAILQTFIAGGVYELEATKQFQDPALAKFAAHQALSNQVNQEGITLLKNGGLLPLDPSREKRILVTGNFAQNKELSGQGSGHVAGYELVTYGEEAQKRFGKERVFVKTAPTDEDIKTASAILVFSGNPWEGENSNRSFALPDDALIARCVEGNPRTVVHLVCGGAVAMDWADKAAGIVWLGFGGQTGAPAAFDVLVGKVNPSGKLPFSFEKQHADSVASNDHRQASNPATYSSPLFVKNKDSFRFEEATGNIHTYDVVYKEGVFVGYRGYDAKDIAVRFPFGHGLSYTQFAYGDLKLTPEGRKLQVEFSVCNTGKTAGAEVAQVYVGDPHASVPRPPRELKGFEKVFLQPGESKTVRMELPESAFQFWSPAAKQWTFEPGEFVIQVGGSSRDLRLKDKATL